MKIQVLGAGCAKCAQLAENAEAAAKAVGIDYTLEKVEDINDIILFGVMTTPALVLNGSVKVVGKVPSVDEIKELLS